MKKDKYNHLQDLERQSEYWRMQRKQSTRALILSAINFGVTLAAFALIVANKYADNREDDVDCCEQVRSEAPAAVDTCVFQLPEHNGAVERDARGNEGAEAVGVGASDDDVRQVFGFGDERMRLCGSCFEFAVKRDEGVFTATAGDFAKQVYTGADATGKAGGEG